MYLQYIALHRDEENQGEKYQQPDVDDSTPEGYDKLISAEVLIPRGDKSVLGKVIKSSKLVWHALYKQTCIL